VNHVKAIELLVASVRGRRRQRRRCAAVRAEVTRDVIAQGSDLDRAQRRVFELLEARWTVGNEEVGPARSDSSLPPCPPA
jgi:hypothetical protein